MAGDDVLLVVGTTGRVGRAFVDNVLMQQPVIAQLRCVRLLCRDAARCKQLFSHYLNGDNKVKVEVVVGDVRDVTTLDEPMKDCTHVFVSLRWRSVFGAASAYHTEFLGTCNLLKCAKRTGCVKQFMLIGSMGIGQAPLLSPVGLFYFTANLFGNRIVHWKWRAEQEVRASGVPYTIVRPTHLVPAYWVAGEKSLVVLPRSPYMDRQKDLKPILTYTDLAKLCMGMMKDERTLNVTLDVGTAYPHSTPTAVLSSQGAFETLFKPLTMTDYDIENDGHTEGLRLQHSSCDYPLRYCKPCCFQFYGSSLFLFLVIVAFFKYKQRPTRLWLIGVAVVNRFKNWLK